MKHQHGFWNSRALSLNLATLGVCSLVSLSALVWATPPAPPVKLNLNDQVRINSARRVLPINLQIREGATSVSITATARPIIEGRPDFDQPAAETVLTQRFDVAGIRKISQSAINIPLSKLKAGQYNLEILLKGENENGGFSDRILRRLMIDEKGNASIKNLRDVVRERTDRQEKSFRAQLEKDPKNPDIRLLMDDTVKVPVDDAKIGRIAVVDNERLLVRPAAVSERFKSFYQENEDKSWSSIDPITVKGRLTFQDIDGVWKPLVNAAVHLWDDDTFGDEHLGSVATDWDGRWQFSVNNDDGFLQDGRDIYYTFKLENTRLKVGKCGGDYEWKSAVRDDLKDGTVVDYGNETGSTDMDAMRVWNTLNIAWNHASTAGGQDPGFVETCFPGTGMFYNGRVNVPGDGATAPDGITHEYGHALMANANGSDPSPGGAHGFDDCSQNNALSWSEGWATGFMLSVRPDGTYNWTEGDTGRSIENFSASCQVGEGSEGRVAASLLDLMDAANDDNGGSLNRGRTDASDANAANRFGLATLFRDTLWGASPHSNITNFWNDLNSGLSGPTRTDAQGIMFYNWMNVSKPTQCAATRITALRLDNAEPTLDGLRNFRDLVLKRSPEGSQLANRYYSNSPEMAKLLLENPNALNEALKVVSYFSDLGNTIGNNKRFVRAMAVNGAFIPETVQTSLNTLFDLFEKDGGDSLKKDVAVTRRSFERFRRMTITEFQQTVSKEKEGAKAEDYIRLNTTQLSPESEKALQDERLQKALEQDAGKRTPGRVIKTPVKKPVLKRTTPVKRPK